MTDERGSPAWYFQASQDFMLNRDTEAAKALFEEARAAIHVGQAPQAVARTLAAKGAKGNAAAIANRANLAELQDVVHHASDDLAAGKTDTPELKKARNLAGHLIADAPEGTNLVAQLKSFGASDALAETLAKDPAVKNEGRKSALMFLAAGVVVFIGGAWLYSTLRPSEYAPGAGVVLIASGLLFYKGIHGLLRK
jgi:hypothetical protein